MSAAATERSLFASKGRATPVGVEPGEPEHHQPVEPPAGACAEDGAAPAEEARPEGGSQDAPAGSLLTFRLRGEPGKSAIGDGLKTALAQAPGLLPSADAAPHLPGHVVPPPAEAAVRQPAAATASTIAEPGPAAASAARLDRPLFPQARRDRDAELATRALAVSRELPRSSAWRIGLPVGAAVVAVAAVGWFVSHGGDSPPSETASVVDAAPAALVANAEAEAAADWQVPTPSAPAQSAETESVAEPGTLPASADEAAASNTTAAATLLTADAPTFDVVRVAPDAPPVLAGRAAPGSRLIVLDNGEVIGTALADANGEWALVTDAPLSAGRHELTLALATPEGAVVVEQADTRTEPSPHEGDGLLTPPLKPVQSDAPAQLFVVQLASVPSASDAEREWARLQDVYPNQLGTASVDIGKVEIGERGTFYRLRTGPFPDRETARRLCAALNAAGQECLVVRQAADH